MAFFKAKFFFDLGFKTFGRISHMRSLHLILAFTGLLLWLCLWTMLGSTACRVWMMQVFNCGMSSSSQ